MLEQIRQYRLYIIMAVLNIAVLVGVIYLLRRDEPRSIAIVTPAPRATATPQIIKVQVNGAVNQPGVYELTLGARLSDALERAGGARPEADLSQLNLARRLNDGEAITVPARAAASDSPTTVVVTTATAAPSARTTASPKVNINTASLEELQTLPRIGATLAQRIIDYRNANGPFKNIEEIKNVKGIGDALFTGIKDLITIQ
jgi:competence protein ComEA